MNTLADILWVFYVYIYEVFQKQDQNISSPTGRNDVCSEYMWDMWFCIRANITVTYISYSYLPKIHLLIGLWVNTATMYTNSKGGNVNLTQLCENNQSQMYLVTLYITCELMLRSGILSSSSVLLKENSILAFTCCIKGNLEKKKGSRAITFGDIINHQAGERWGN